MYSLITLVLLGACINLNFAEETNVCNNDGVSSCEADSSNVYTKHCSEKQKRYILYDVNPGEGFNLRRDIYVRIAPLVRLLNDKDTFVWVLVLPPWGSLPHWNNSNEAKFYPWGSFFDLKYMKQYIPVLEYKEYLDEYGLDHSIDVIYQLQHFPFNETEKWKEKIELDVRCEYPPRYEKDQGSDLFVVSYWDENVYAKKAGCMAIRGQASTIFHFLLNSQLRSVLFDRAEVILWDNYGGPTWWAARKSMKFTTALADVSATFLESKNLISSDPHRKDFHSNLKNYVGVHLRRSDFLVGRRSLPSIQGAAQQIVNIIVSNLNLTDIFLATDATKEEAEAFIANVTLISKAAPRYISVHRYHCPPEFSQGHCAIIDQIVCSHSQYFIGTEESTFTFRIFEEREIMGFDPINNFNYLCSDNLKCSKATQWRLN